METPKESGNMTGQKIRLIDLIGFQEGAIVSKELLNKPTGTITFFAFDKDQGLSEHTAPFDAFVFIPEGEVDITIEGKVHKLRAGDTITMPANKPHALKAVLPFKMLLVMIKS